MSDAIRLLCLNALFLTTGIALVRGFGIPFSGSWLPTALGLSPVVGILAASLVAAEVAALGVAIGTATVAVTTLCAVGWGIFGGKARRARLSSRAWQRTSLAARITEIALLGFLGFAAIRIFELFSVTPLNAWDGWAIWAARANELYSSGNAWNAAFQTAPYYVQHPDYPILYPSLEALSFHALGRFDVTLIHIEPAALLVSALLALWGLLRIAVAPWLAALAAAGLSGINPLIQNFNWNYADSAVALMVALGLVSLALWVESEDVTILFLTALFLAGASLIKEEGLMFSACALVAGGAAAFVSGRDVRRLLPVAAAVVVAYLPWEIFIRANDLGAASTYSFSSLLSPSYLVDHANRVRLASDTLARNLVHTWGLPAALGLIAFACALLARRAGLAVLLGVWAALGFAGLVASYLATTLDVVWQLQTSANRVVGTIAVGSAALAPVLGWKAWRAVQPSLLLRARSLHDHSPAIASEPSPGSRISDLETPA